jgi:hypothetical protein
MNKIFKNGAVNFLLLSVFLIILTITAGVFSADMVSVFVRQAAAGSGQTISLQPGFNFISFTVVPGDSAPELISKNSDIEDIYLYNATAGSFLSVSEGTLSKLSTGRGYIIKSKNRTSITINGPPVDIIGDIPLKKGFNLLGLSKFNPASTVNSFTKILDLNSSITGVYKWSAAAGSFLQVVRDPYGRPVMLDGSDPSLNPGESYFINVSEDTKINYDTQIKFSKTLAGLFTDPASASIAAGGIYDLGAVKVYALYSDGSTDEVTASSFFTANAGKITGKVYSAPAYPSTVIIAVSYTEPASGISKEGYFTLFITSSNQYPVKTTSYKCVYKLASQSRIIDETNVITESVTQTQVILKLSPNGEAPKAGDVIIGYYGDGYLRKAASVSAEGDRVFVSTTKAVLEDAFESLDYSYKGKLSTLHASDTSAPGSLEELAVGRFLRSKSIMPAPAANRSIISKDNLKKILDHASLSVTLTKADISFDPIIECDIEIGWFKLKKFLFIVGGDLSCGVEFQVDAIISSGLPLKSELELFHSQPYVFTVGPVPFSFEWDINCGIDASAAVTGSYAYCGEWLFSLRVGAEYDGNTWKKINDIKRNSSAEDNYALKGSIEIKPYLNFGFALKIVGITGPKMYIEVFLSFLAEMAAANKIDISVSAGAGANVSFVVELLSWTLAEFKAELFSISWSIYERSLDFYLPPPIISTPAGIYLDEQLITITSTVENAVIKYTINGVSPSSDYGTVYEKPFTIKSSCTVEAVLIKTIGGVRIVSDAIKVFYNVVSAADPNVVKVKICTSPAGMPHKTTPCTIPYGITEDEWRNCNFATDDPEYVYAIKGKKFSWSYVPVNNDGWVFERMSIIFGGTFSGMRDDVNYETYPTGNLNIKAVYKRYNSEKIQLYPLIVIVYPSKDCGTVKIDNNNYGYCWPWGTEITATAAAAPGYILSYWKCNMDTQGFLYEEKNVFKTGDVDNTLKAYFSVKKNAEIIYEPSGTIASHELLRYYSLGSTLGGNYLIGYYPAPENKYFGADDESLSVKATAAAGYKINRIDIDNGSGRTVFGSYQKADTVQATRIPADSNLKIYIVTVPE